IRGKSRDRAVPGRGNSGGSCAIGRRGWRRGAVTIKLTVLHASTPAEQSARVLFVARWSWGFRRWGRRGEGLQLFKLLGDFEQAGIDLSKRRAAGGAIKQHR